MAIRQQYVDYSDGVPDKVKQFVVYYYRHIRCSSIQQWLFHVLRYKGEYCLPHSSEE